MYFVGTEERVSSLFSILARGMSYDELCSYARIDKESASQVIEAAGRCFENGIGLPPGESDPREEYSNLHVGSTIRRYELRGSSVRLELLWGTLGAGESLFAFCDQMRLEPYHAMDIAQIIRIAGEMLERSFSSDENPH